ncbi:MAG: EamA family transporter RarD [Anaerolineales bacterium]|nr:EamA family transporter RarD [Anaerolineales bacterium]MCX7753947.1 EamA family transporter RarD [Anaerolineales bacterium]MDW8278026.1 EamA family transporter RarD [Anaerolineales bacterium]
MEKTGLLLAFGAYFIWGVFPIYWKWLKEVEALELLAHRIIWSFVFLALFLLVARKRREFLLNLRNQKVIRTYFVAAVLIGLNWLVYVWAVNSGFIVETSLGYFINPLISVSLGVLFLRERLRPLQWLPVGLAALGVAYLTFVYGRLPWIALTLAFSFGLYGLVKKVAPLSSVYGLTLETGILFLPAVLYLGTQEIIGQAVFLHTSLATNLLLVGAGIVTTIPLLMFAAAAHRIPLTMIGLMQYLAPTLQFLLGVLVYKEPFSAAQAIGFGIVWTALVLFWVENRANARALRAEPVPELGEG